MKTNRFSNMLIAFLLTSMLFGCSKEQKQETCLVGTWSNESEMCAAVRHYVFNSDGTGLRLTANCGCSDGSDWTYTVHFTWQVTSSGLTLTYGDDYKCDDPNGLFTDQISGSSTFDTNCDGDVLTLENATYIRQ